MKKKDYVGLKSVNNFGSKIEIIAYRNAKDVDIYFEEYNYIVKSRYSHFKNGDIKCPYERRFYNVGFMGKGIYKDDNNNKKCFHVWTDMLRRCYDVNGKYYDRYGAIGCRVCEEWLCFQNFAEWYYNNYYGIDNKVMNLDKDILIKGNKIYSPYTCCFVPNEINALFTKRQRHRGNTPIGVIYCEAQNGFKACYKATLTKNGKHVYLGCFKTAEEAFNAYKVAKEEWIKDLANKWKDKLDPRVHAAMCNYQVEMTD